MKGLLILITVFVVSLLVLFIISAPGALFRGMYFLTGDTLDKPEDDAGHKMFLLFGNGARALAMVTAEICAFAMRLASTTIQPVCTIGFIVNNIPFLTLNFSIVMMLVVDTVSWVFFEFQAPSWFSLSVVITTIFVTNKGARAHVALRLRQQIDSFTIGG